MSSLVTKTPFSARHNFVEPKEISIWESAPDGLRFVVIETARQLGIAPSELRAVLCFVLRAMPDRGNWSEYPNIWDEVVRLIEGCEWFKVYDLIEALYFRVTELDARRYEQQASAFSETINRTLVDEGIGWKLTNGQIVVRGDEAFEAIVLTAKLRLAEAGRPTAAKHIEEALACLSRRPGPNTSGAAYHAMGSLECVARDLTNEPKLTLGEILKRYPTLLPKPLDTALSQIWGFASNEARHVVEGRDIGREEAELIVGLSASVSTFLLRKSLG